MNNQGTTQEFIRDVTPFFYRQNINYVDVGAHKGNVFREFVGSALIIGEAHLFEPNPTSFTILQDEASKAFKRRSLNLHNQAVGNTHNTVRMQAADTMTKVIDKKITSDSAAITNTNSFDVKCTTLDTIANNFTDRHISLLKIDVEGFEVQVLEGAHQFLTDQRVDVIYIEAGANPQGTQQTYYRLIDDIMLKHGYRLFRIYEQKHEWMEDSPFLRRMNLAYFSSSFAARHPYKLTHELYAEAIKHKGASSTSPSAAKKSEGNDSEQLKKLQKSLNDLQEQHKQTIALAEELAKELDKSQNQVQQLGSTKKQLEQLNLDYQAQSSEQKKLAEELEKAKKQAQQLGSTKKQLEQLKQDYQAQLNEVEQLKAQQVADKARLEERASFFEQVYKEARQELRKLRSGD
ncbi:FkbM family methyltransferase [Zobellella sp. DQSA1]|uniref:FkbM family methyltransferase n=1 Tax=Zobellella sp. DQSA1 TaxID=3342386 RepID=UPI0035C08408